MVYKIKNNGISNYPNPTINCSVECFLQDADKTDETKAVYWIPFQISLVECIEKKMSQEQIEAYIEQQGKERFNAPEMQAIYSAIELGASLTIGNSSTTNTTDATKIA